MPTARYLDAMKRALESLDDVERVVEFLGDGGEGSLLVTTVSEWFVVVIKPYVLAEGGAR